MERGILRNKKIEGGLRIYGKFHKKSEPGKPLVSIVTVVRNGEKYLEQTIESILNQTYENIEYIIIDGASTDGTLNIIRKYDDHIAYWISEPDGGIYYAMNKGVGIATGEWIYFLGSDDVILNVLHEITVNFIDEKTTYYGDVYMPKRHKLYDGEFTSYKLMLRNICHQAIFYPKKVFKKYLFQTKYKIYADYYLNVLCFRDSEYNFEYIPKVVAIFNEVEGLSATGEDIAFQKDKIMVYKKQFPYYLYLFYQIRCCIGNVLEVMGMKKGLKKIRDKIVGWKLGW